MPNAIHNFTLPTVPFSDSLTGYRVELKSIFVTFNPSDSVACCQEVLGVEGKTFTLP